MCGKALYDSEKQAKKHMRIIQQRDGQGKTPERVYFCERCKGFHLTSRPMTKAWR